MPSQKRVLTAFSGSTTSRRFLALNPKSWLDAFRKADRLFQLENKHGAIIEAQAAEIQKLKDRLTQLEQQVKAREEIRVAEAKGAAAAAGSAAASMHVADLARRMGMFEERLHGVASRQLAPPDAGSDA